MKHLNDKRDIGMAVTHTADICPVGRDQTLRWSKEEKQWMGNNVTKPKERVVVRDLHERGL